MRRLTGRDLFPRTAGGVAGVGQLTRGQGSMTA